MKLSVIVCTRNRETAMTSCLTSIAESFAHAGLTDAEIIVVDNASSDNTSHVVKQWADANKVPVQFLYEAKKGLSAARNCALRAATGDIIAFTDDDCRPAATYVSYLLAHYAEDTEPILRGGRVELGNKLDLPLTIKTDNERVDYKHPTHPCGFIHGANMTMSRGVFEKLGFFDERLGAGTSFPGEDCDYTICAVAAGIRVQYVPDMTVYHFHGRRGKKEAQTLFAGYMRANGALYVKHLRSSPLLVHHLWWDIKQWSREIRENDEGIFPDIGIGHRQVVVGNILGMILFSGVLAKEFALGLFRGKAASGRLGGRGTDVRLED